MQVLIAGLFKEGPGAGEGISGSPGCEEMFYLEVSEDFQGQNIRLPKGQKKIYSIGSYKFMDSDEVSGGPIMKGG